MVRFEHLVDYSDSPYLLKEDAPTYQDMMDTVYLDGPELRVSVPVEYSKEKDVSPIYRNGKFPAKPKCAISPSLDTYYSLFKASASLGEDRKVLAYRQYNYNTGETNDEYKFISHAETSKMIKHFGSGLLYLLFNNVFKESEKYVSHSKIDTHAANYLHYNNENISFIVTLFSGNRWEWILTDLMCCAFGITSTTLYDTLGPTASSHILRQTESPVVVTSKAHIERLVNMKKEEGSALGNLISIISLDPLQTTEETPSGQRDRYLVEIARKHKILVYDLYQVMRVGEIFPSPEMPSRPDSVYSINYTSGTTGLPKGVILTQRTACCGLLYLFTCLRSDPGSLKLCYLPLAHIYERQAAALSVVSHTCLGFPKLDFKPVDLVNEFKLFKPSIIAAVPRVLTKLEAAIKNSTIESESAFKRSLFDKLFKSKEEKQLSYDGATSQSLLYDYFLIRPIRKAVGFDNAVVCVSGSAPISPATIIFLRSALGIGIKQGYGLTESFAGVFTSYEHEAKVGSCGSISPTCELRVRSIPEMGFSLDDPEGPKGELQLRGPQIADGYYKSPEENAKAFDAEGWFSTGDVCRLEKGTNRLYIIDRVKNFFKLAQGEYITPEKVENVYLNLCPILSQIYVHGDSLQNYLVAIVGGNPTDLAPFLVKNCGVSSNTLKTDNDIISAVSIPSNRLKLINYINSKANSLSGFEKVQNIHVEIEPLREERDVVTPTMKVKRQIARQFFADAIDKMYAEGPLPQKSKL